MDAKLERLAERYLRTEAVGYVTVVSFTVDDKTHEVRVDQTPAHSLAERSRSATAFLVQRLCEALCDCGVRERMAERPTEAGTWSHTGTCRLVREMEAQ